MHFTSPHLPSNIWIRTESLKKLDPGSKCDPLHPAVRLAQYTGKTIIKSKELESNYIEQYKQKRLVLLRNITNAFAYNSGYTRSTSRVNKSKVISSGK